MTGWTGRIAVEIADAVRHGDVTPHQVVVEHLERLRPWLRLAPMDALTR
ncbi:hypothetical protein ACFRQM_17220 [Streptomyces sp. NPDC056831]